MTQLELDLRPPLTVQYKLPLDYSNCHRNCITSGIDITNGSILFTDMLSNLTSSSISCTSNFIISDSDVKGQYEVVPNFFIGIKEKPSLFKRLITKHLLGWKWINT